MKRWEIQELKRVAEAFSVDFCKSAYEYYLDSALEGDYESQSKVDSWSSNKFTIRVQEDKGIVNIGLHGLNKVNYSDSIRLTDLVDVNKKDKYGFFSLKEMITYMNSFRIVPDCVDIECTSSRVTRLVADGVVYYEFTPVDFL